MAGDVIIRVDAETNAAVNAYLKLVEAQGKVDAGAKKNKQSLSEFEKAAARAGKEIGNVSGGMAKLMDHIAVDPVSLGIQAVTSLITAWRQATNQVQAYQDKIFEIAAREDVKKAPEIQKLFAQANTPGASDQFKTELFLGLQKNLKGADLNKAFQEAVQSAPGVALGDAGKFGEMFGQLQNLAPGMSGDDLRDLTFSTFQGLRGQTEKFDQKQLERMIAGGMSLPGALGTLVSFGETEQGTAGLKRMLDLTQEQREIAPRKAGQRETDAEALVRSFFAEGDSGKRMAQLFAPGGADLRSALLGGKSQAVELGLEGRAGATQQVLQDLTRNRAEEQIAGGLGLGVEGSEEAMVRRLIREGQKDDKSMMGNLPVVGDLLKGFSEEVAVEQGLKALDQIKRGEQVNLGESLGGKELQSLIEALQRLNETMKARENVNAHTE